MPNKPRDPLVGVTLDGRFLVEELIGSGGMSNVYRATQLRVNRDVAIKTLKVQVDQPVYRERFQREVDLLCALSHPNIVTVYDCLLGPDGQPCVVMDYLRGRSLEQLLIDEGPLSTDRFATIFVQVLSALEHAHRKGVIHRDIKPGNIVMLDRETDFVKVVDFGLAKFNQESRRLTHTGELWGSPPYMSPEQCMGKPDSERSDIYSVGIVMYEMLTGKDPYHQATSIFELIQCHVNRPPPALRDINPLISVPAKLEEVLFKAMAKDSDCRYQTANTLKEDIVSACLTATDSNAIGVAAWAAAGGSISSGGQTGITYSGQRPATDSIWYNGPPGTASGDGIANGSNTAGDVNGSSSAGRPAQSVSPWSREGAAKLGSPSGDSAGSTAGDAGRGAFPSAHGTDTTSNQGLASSFTGGFGTAKPQEECTVCGKPIQKQRRGSMTAWILADHHKVMEKISGMCECPTPSSGAPIVIDEAQKVTAARPNQSGDTAMHMAKILARQGLSQNEESQPVTNNHPNANAGKFEPLFDDPNKRSNKSAMRYSADRVTVASLMGNQIVVAVVALLLVGGLVFGAMQMFNKVDTRDNSVKAIKTSTDEKPTPPDEKKPVDTKPDTVLQPPALKEDDQLKPVRKPDTPKKVSNKKPPKSAVRKPRVTAPPKPKQSAPKPKNDRWNDLQNFR